MSKNFGRELFENVSAVKKTSYEILHIQGATYRSVHSLSKPLLIINDSPHSIARANSRPRSTNPFQTTFVITMVVILKNKVIVCLI